MEKPQIIEFLLQALEHERGGVKVYETALECVLNDDLREEFRKYHEQTRRHVQILTDACLQLDVDPDQDTPGREVVRMMGQSLVEAMRKAKSGGKPAAAQIVACECVVLAEVKDHLNWELIGQLAQKGEGDAARALTAAYEEVEDQEDEHLYHSRGWCRELWIEQLGMQPVLPPPEERQHVKTAVGAARAAHSRKPS